MPKLVDLLDEMTDEEVVDLSLSAFPDRIWQIHASKDLRQWLRLNGEWESLLPKIPLSVLERLTRDRIDPANPLALNDESSQVLSRHLSRTSSRLIQRGRDYIDHYEEVVWDPVMEQWNAVVFGTRLYELSVTLSGEEDCTCPYFEENQCCKHTAGLRTYLLREYEKLQGEGVVEPPFKPSAPPSITLPTLDPELLQGLQALRAIGSALRGPETVSANDREEVVYSLEFFTKKGRVRRADLVPRSRR